MGLKRLVHFKVIEMKVERVTSLAGISNLPTHKLINFKNESYYFYFTNPFKNSLRFSEIIGYKVCKNPLFLTLFMFYFVYF